MEGLRDFFFSSGLIISMSGQPWSKRIMAELFVASAHSKDVPSLLAESAWVVISQNWDSM